MIEEVGKVGIIATGNHKFRDMKSHTDIHAHLERIHIRGGQCRFRTTPGDRHICIETQIATHEGLKTTHSFLPGYQADIERDRKAAYLLLDGFAIVSLVLYLVILETRLKVKKRIGRTQRDIVRHTHLEAFVNVPVLPIHNPDGTTCIDTEHGVVLGRTNSSG